MAAVVLFLATAAVVIWQNLRLAVLWDLSYILENSYRISLGEVPYRDFPLAHAPLTFLIQAMLIKFTGRVFFHHVLYCAAAGGVATVLTWRILWNLLDGVVDSAWWMAFLLGVPVSVLGIYCIFPHPFYDPDCTFAILVCIYFLQDLDRKGLRPVRAFLTGMVLVVPLFTKQNTGLAFLGSTTVMLALLIGLDVRRSRPVAGYLWLVAGLGTALAAALLLIHLTVGLANYVHWTMQYAASRRMPRLADILSVYQEHWEPPWWVAAFVAGALLRWLNRRGTRVLALLSSSLMSLPFAWMFVFQFTGEDSSDRAERLLALWPFLLIVALIFSVPFARRRLGIERVLPFIVIGTIHGGFLSQQLWGSTYAMWPLLMLLIGSTVAALPTLVNKQSAWDSVALTCMIVISMLVAGGFYVASHERLDYAELSGDMTRSMLPALAGLSVRGAWIPQFEQLVRFTEQEIPKPDGVLMIPGEDLFYYTTGRHPRFPVLVFDHTVNPYSPEQILELSRSQNIEWLVVKRKVQLDQDPVEDKDRLLMLLCQDFKRVESLENYDVYRRLRPAAPLSATVRTMPVAGSPPHR